ncbi:hypothetical protein [Xanthomonas campestris]|uniref:hypothetical protein n=1 Tax=Xanthomonas campestris TaxID=339 RepID=UPI001EE1125D|nr:hypothetical protein [Xanthomonas campestris]
MAAGLTDFLPIFCATKPAGVLPAGFFVLPGHAYSAWRRAAWRDLGGCFPKIYRKANKTSLKRDGYHDYARGVSKT